ncbi:hypothetical protein [Curtobacterium sp. MCBD17_040]|uniref:hypothetical protein n=1 Tax=Curtobacterium sp. MCBD17_040 TaxID=2175674 RepID=UPI0011B3D22F|nr:hypothetical protein [Curtobacterium sp. MCBD17_040]WIB64362.1 hypothetical protein DEI94_03975 [Curtobacterium sp. MCBD17_040]
MKQAVNFTLGLIVVLIVLAVAVFLGWHIWAWFLGLPSKTMTAIAALVGVVSVPIITYFTTRRLEKQRAREEAVRKQKTDFYDKTISGLIGMFNLGRPNEPADQAKMSELFVALPAPMLTFASRGVIRSWNDLKGSASRDSNDTKAMILAFEGLLKAMRKDLGHPTWSHQPGELVSVFVNDADTFFKKQ